MNNEKDIDKLIVEAAKEYVGNYKPHSSTSEPMRKLYEAVEASKPRAAIRGVMTVNTNPCFENSYQVPAIEATEAVETRCGPTAGVNRDDIHAIVMHGVPLEMAKKDTNAIMQLIADAQAPIEVES